MIHDDTSKHGMRPIGSRAARLLILGSLPGDESIRRQQYYAHPQNQFWRILCAVFDAPFVAAYEDRLALLEHHRIAVWDVLQNANRRGSLDAAITAPIANDLQSFFAKQPKIAAIGFNGQKAAALFKSYVIDPNVVAHTAAIKKAVLPSTSPAAAMLRLEQKIESWRAFLRYETSNLNPEAHPTAKRPGSTDRR